MKTLDNFVDFLNKAYFISPEDKGQCYEYAAKSLYLNQLAEYVYTATNQLCCYTAGNPCAHVVLIYEDAEIMDESFKDKVREQIMQQSLDQSLVYVTCINKIKDQSYSDKMINVLLNEMICINPKTIILVRRSGMPENDLFDKAKNALCYANLPATIHETELLTDGELNMIAFDIVVNDIINLEKERGKEND